jgi:hypothetical protein
LWAIDTAGIVVGEDGEEFLPDASSMPLQEVLPERRFNVLICGAAAAIPDYMLTHGSQIVERCVSKYEPILILCLVGFPADPDAIRSGVDVAVEFLKDEQTTIDAIVWYDIEHRRSANDLRALVTAAREKCVPILALRPFARWEQALNEYTTAFHGGGLLTSSGELYSELRAMIHAGTDSDPDGILPSVP